MASMFLLLQADPGHAGSLARAVEALPDVISAVVTSGPYDVVAEVGPADAERQAAIRDHVRQASGLARLCICRPQVPRAVQA